MNVNKSYFDCDISNNNSYFVISESDDKSEKDASSLQTLDKIAFIVEKQIPYQRDVKDVYSNLSAEQLYKFLGKKAEEIYSEFKQKELKHKSHSSSEEKAHLALTRIQNSLEPPKVFPLSDDVIHYRIAKQIPVEELGNFAQINRHANSHAKASLLAFAQQYGYEGTDNTESIKYVKSLKLVMTIISHDRQLDKSLILFKEIDYYDIFVILQEANIYPNSEKKQEYGNKKTKPYCHPFLLKCARECFNKTPLPHLDYLDNLSINNYKTALMRVISSNWTEMMDILFPIPQHKEDILKCLEWAVSVDSLDVALLLLEQKNEDPNFLVDVGYENLIFDALNNNNPVITTSLIKYGANVNALDSNGQTPLIIATQKNYLEVVKILMKNGANAEIRHPTDSKTPLMIAIRNNNTEIVTLLLEMGANPNTANHRGSTPLMFACKNSPALVTLLLNNGANIDSTNDSGDTALKVAIVQNNIDNVSLLIKNRANLEAVDKGGNTPLITATQMKGDNLDIMKLLLINGVNVNAKNKMGESPLFIAMKADESRMENPKMLRLLLENGADINIRDARGNTLLIQAIHNKNTMLINFLLENNANPNVTNQFKNSALHVACFEKVNKKIIELLLQHNADIHLTNAKGDTPLSIAKGNFSPKLYRLLKSYDKS